MADLGCSQNAAIAYDFLRGKGLRDFQAAAIVGNLQQESGLDPRAVAPSEGAHGIAQWRLDRWQSLLEFAAALGHDPVSLDLQLEFLWHELESTPSFGLAPLSSAPTIEDAVVVFQDQFERPNRAKSATSNRIAFARAALFACPAVKIPHESARRGGVVAAAVGVAALVAAAGYGVYKAVTARPSSPEPEYKPPPPPVYRPFPRRIWPP